MILHYVIVYTIKHINPILIIFIIIIKIATTKTTKEEKDEYVCKETLRKHILNYILI
jgi:hypothetical protein